jgi:uncharacterized protein (DUF849 family)
MEKVVITAAVAGSQTTKEQTPFLPLTPEEIAEEAYRCFNAGASMVHIHPRDPRKEVSDIEVLGEAVRLIREKCNIIIQAGTGGRDRFGKHREDGDRLKLLEINPKPDMISVNTGSFFFHSLTQKREGLDSSLRFMIPAVSLKWNVFLRKGFWKKGRSSTSILSWEWEGGFRRSRRVSSFLWRIYHSIHIGQ